MIQSTKLAKVTYWLSGQLSHIKTYTKFYKLKNEDDPVGLEGPIEFEVAGAHWSPWGFAWTVLDWSYRLDTKHWNHWALDHEDHPGKTCPACKGWIDTPRVENVIESL